MIQEKCTQCDMRIDLTRTHGPGDRDDWCSGCVGAHGRIFCSMECADEWEKDPRNAEAVAESMRNGRCSAYVDCCVAELTNDIRPASPYFLSCDAKCPLRKAAVP